MQQQPLEEYLTISAIMGNEMKSAKDKITIQMKGNGPIGTMLVTADNFPRVKRICSKSSCRFTIK